jgi:hypothetical protein
MNRRPPLASLAPITLALVLAACSAAPAPTPSDAASQPAPTTDAPTATPIPSASATTEAMSDRPSASPSATTAELPDDELLTVALTDVRSGESFTLGELAVAEGPVLLEPMAIWCTSCRSQQNEVRTAHESGSFTSVSLDVDLSEVPEDLARYATDQGWDWRFAMADAALYRLLQDRFGVAATNPPSTPLIVIERDGTVRPLDFGVGVRSAEQLLAEIGAG